MTYHFIPGKSRTVPILVSVPHAGVAFPEELRDHYRPELSDPPDDTDFYVHQLYDFVPELGISLIYARYSRWVIDLNRSPDHQSLYHDGRLITALTPTTDFVGRAIYRRPELEPETAEIARRKAQYFDPYYSRIHQWLEQTRKTYGQALLWDAHSIRRRLPRIHPEPFPDLVLGDNDGRSASPALIRTAWESLAASPFHATHNVPFRGGNITRHFGQPFSGIHALQLEMAKPLYMDDSETRYDAARAQHIRGLLHSTFERLIEELT